MSGNLTGIVEEWVAKEYGGLFTTDADTLTIGTSPIVIAQSNFERVALILINLSPNVVYAAINGTPSASEGIYLAPSGGNFTSVMRNDLVLQSFEFSAVAPAGNSSLYVVEVTRYAKLPNEGNADAN